MNPTLHPITVDEDVRFLTDFNEQLSDTTDDCVDCGDETVEFTIPGDLSALSVTELETLKTQAMDLFDNVYADGTNFEPGDVQTLSDLTSGIETLQAELSSRAEEAAALAAKAAELSAKVKGEDTGNEAAETSEAAASAEVTPAVEATEAPAQTQTVQASGIRVNLSRMQRNAAAPAAPEPAKAEGPQGVRDIVFAAGIGGAYNDGVGLTWNEAGEQLSQRLTSYNHAAFANAAANKRHLQQQLNLVTVRKPIPEDLLIKSHDPMEIESVLRHAADEYRLPKGSLTASGGWCAPSETMYELAELESRDGIFSLPEVGITRGGIRRTLGPNFADIYNAGGFSFTEEEDIAGDYDGEGGGTKPCFKVDCPEWEEFRLGVDGLCIQAGILQSKAYPEMLARVMRGALIAHDHKMAAKSINEVAAGSTAVTMANAASGALSPILDAIELQAEHMKYTHRLSRSTTLEAVFPFWVRGLIRSDLAKRNGVDSFLSITDAQINGWFSDRGIAPQYIYNWQDLNVVSAASFTGWPGALTFVMYPAGTWIRGTAELITMDSLYDSTLLGTNDFTALFTEEGSMVVKMNHDSRAVTVPVCPDGSTAQLVELGCNTISLSSTTTTTTTV